MLQTRFVCILLILILPFVTSFFNLGINRINTVERLRVIRRRQFFIQCCSGYWSCYAGPDGRLRTVTTSKAIEASTEPINAAVTTTTEQIILSSTTFNPNVPTNLTMVEISTINSALSSTTSVATTAQPSAITTSNTASTTTGVISSSTSASTNTQPITSTSATTSITTNASTTTQSIASSSTTTSTSTGTTTTTSTSTATGTTTTTEPVTSTSTATGTSTGTTTTTEPITSTSTATSTPTGTTTTTEPITSTSTATGTTTTTEPITSTSTTGTTTTTTTSTTPCPNACLTPECLAANDTLANIINAISLPTLSPSSWPLQTLNGRMYHVDVSQELTWYNAQAECMKHGMELATIGSQAEHDAITNYIQGAGKGGSEFLIGGNKMGTQCIYVWDNGEPMTYTNWNTGNPAQQTTEECMTWYGGKWSDFPCSWTRWFICEEVDETTTSTTSTTTTSTTTTTTPCPLACKTSSCLASGGVKTAAITNGVPSPTLSPSSLTLLSVNGRNYYLEKSSLSWYDALAFCMKYGMTLATLGTQAESDAINSYLQSLGISSLAVFLSGNKIGGQCNYVWESGEPMTYTNWLPGNPAEATTEECMVWIDGKWGDLPCDFTRWFLCEQI